MEAQRDWSYPAGNLLYPLARTGPVVPAHPGDDQERGKRRGSFWRTRSVPHGLWPCS